MQHKTLVGTQTELDELTRMRYRQLIDDETFIRERNRLQNEISLEIEARAEKWLELTEKTFRFATYARKSFLMGGLELKKEILAALGKTPIIKSGKLVIETNEWFVSIENDYPALEKECLGLELDKKPMDKAKTESLNSIRLRWLPGSDSNRQPSR